MSKKRGVSLDEKRLRMLQIFHETKEFFTLKEIEKIAVQKKQIVAQSVKDVLEELVNDGLVKSEKIGTSTYYWKFPGDNITATEARISETQKQLVEAEFKLQKVKEKIEKEKELKNDTEERRNLIKEIEKLKKEEQEIKQEIFKFSDVDEEAIAETNKNAQRYKEVANIWTDNIFSLQTWSKNKFGVSEEDLNKQFNIPEDLDYLE